MKKVYACLLGEWVNLSDDDSVVMGDNQVPANQWYEENAEISSLKSKRPNTYYDLDYVKLHYQGKDYRINPIFIQIVEE